MNPTSSEDSDLCKLQLELAQASAQHHDSLVWQGIGVFLGLQAALLAISGGGAKDNQWWFCAICGVIGLFLVVLMHVFVSQQRELKKLKYQRAKECEALLGFDQHAETEKVPRRWTWFVTMIVMFGMSWLVFGVVAVFEAT